MTSKFSSLKSKEVISIKDGTKYGKVSDIEIDVPNSRIISLIVYGKLRLFGFFGREDDYIIRWEEVETIGDDAILVNSRINTEKKKKGFLNKILG